MKANKFGYRQVPKIVLFFFLSFFFQACNYATVMQVCKVHPALLTWHISTTTNVIEIHALRCQEARKGKGWWWLGGVVMTAVWREVQASYSINASSFSIGSIPDGFVWTQTSLLFFTLLSNDVSELGCVEEWRASDLLQQRLCSAAHQSHVSQTLLLVLWLRGIGWYTMFSGQAWTQFMVVAFPAVAV